jgi:hypothetical protein
VLAVVEGTASPSLGPVAASVVAVVVVVVVPVVVAPVVAPWPVALPMLNDPGRWKRQARRSPIAPLVAQWAVPVALLGALNLPPVVEVPNPRAVLVVVDWTLAASPLSVRNLWLERPGTTGRYAALAQRESYWWPTSLNESSTENMGEQKPQ